MAGTIPKGGFKDRDSFKAWLKSLAEDQSVPFARVLAHRAALRALPSVHRAFSESISGEFDPSSLTLAVFRANAISRVARKYPTREIERAAVFAFVRASRTAAFAAADAAAFAAARASRAAASASDAAADAAGAAGAAAGAMWDALTRDARELERRETADGFEDTPLWAGEPPFWWLDEMRILQEALFSSTNNSQGNTDDKYWSNWLDWYDAVVLGQSPWNLPRATANELEKRIALGDGRDDFWDTGKRTVAEINAEIAGWVEEARQSAQLIEPDSEVASEDDAELLVQSPAPFSFQALGGKITARPQTGAPFDPAMAVDILSELLEKAKTHRKHLEACGNAVSSHVLNSASSIERCVQEWAEKPAPGVLLMRLRTLEAIIDAYDTEDGRGMLYPDAILAMRDMQGSVNDFIRPC